MPEDASVAAQFVLVFAVRPAHSYAGLKTNDD